MSEKNNSSSNQVNAIVSRHFRVVEEVGCFFIETLYIRKVGIFKKRKIEEWRKVDCHGCPMIARSYQQPLRSFYSLGKAKKVIESIKKGIIVHNYNG